MRSTLARKPASPRQPHRTPDVLGPVAAVAALEHGVRPRLRADGQVVVGDVAPQQAERLRGHVLGAHLGGEGPEPDPRAVDQSPPGPATRSSSMASRLGATVVRAPGQRARGHEADVPPSPAAPPAAPPRRSAPADRCRTRPPWRWVVWQKRQAWPQPRVISIGPSRGSRSGKGGHASRSHRRRRRSPAQVAALRPGEPRTSVRPPRRRPAAGARPGSPPPPRSPARSKPRPRRALRGRPSGAGPRQRGGPGRRGPWRPAPREAPAAAAWRPGEVSDHPTTTGPSLEASRMALRRSSPGRAKRTLTPADSSRASTAPESAARAAVRGRRSARTRARRGQSLP